MTNDHPAIGEYLKQARKAHGFSLKDIAQRTCININVLRDLETGNISKLPNKTYIRGFIKSYAKEVGLDSNYTMKLLEYTYDQFEGKDVSESFVDPVAGEDPYIDNAVMSETKNSKDPDKLENVVHEKVQLPIRSIVIGASTLAILISGFIFLRNQFKETQKSLEKISKEMPAQTKAEIQAKGAIEKVADPVVVAPKADPVVPGLKIKPAPKKKIEAPVKKVETEKKIVPTKKDKARFTKATFIRKFKSPLYTINDKELTGEDKKLLTSQYQKAVKSNSEAVFVTALKGDTWVTYKSDDLPIKSFNLRKGRKISITAKSKILLFLGNSNIAKVFYKNTKVQYEAPRSVKSFVFPPKEIDNYHIPLFIREDDGTIYTVREYQLLQNEYN